MALLVLMARHHVVPSQADIGGRHGRKREVNFIFHLFY